jgi:hypothetical protein
MPLLGFLEFTALAIGILAVIAGEFFGLAKGLYLGVFLIGAAFALGGLESLYTRRMCFRLSDGAGDTYAGTPAIAVGISALMIGAGIIAAAYLLSDGLWHSTVAYLQRRPAALLAGGGVLLALAGIFFMAQGRVLRGLLGFLLLLAGVGAAGLGALEWLEPAAFDELARKLPRELRWPR